MAQVGIVRDDRYLLHDMGPHPESPERLKVIYQMLKEPEIGEISLPIPPRPATRDEIEMVHSPVYVDQIAGTAGKPYVRLDPDTSTCAASHDAAVWAVGGFLEAVDAVIEGKVDRAFALVRPPGHHAEQSRAMGFCLFNNIAIGARHAQKRHGLDRILIADWDLHHGNGTQHTFYEEKGVLYFSTHQYPYYPGTGSVGEVGHGEGEGYTVNAPLGPGCGDTVYANLFTHILRPIALVYKPQLILVSAGFDTYHRDPLGGMRVTEMGFARLMNVLKDIARSTCSGKIVVTLEGGYDLTGQSQSVRAVLLEMGHDADWIDRDKCQKAEKADYDKIEKGIQAIQSVQGTYWTCF